MPDLSNLIWALGLTSAAFIAAYLVFLLMELKKPGEELGARDIFSVVYLAVFLFVFDALIYGFIYFIWWLDL